MSTVISPFSSVARIRLWRLSSGYLRSDNRIRTPTLIVLDALPWVPVSRLLDYLLTPADDPIAKNFDAEQSVAEEKTYPSLL